MSAQSAAAVAGSDGRPWARAAAWLAFLGPFFFASYGFATWWTAQRHDVPFVVFEWERWIPFVPWTIVPYWAIDVLYGISLFLCATRAELDRHALRLFTAQVISVSAFLLYPLRFTFERPEVEGLFGAMFTVLGGFDRPFNQAPSLHISLLVILWALYARHTPPRWRIALHAAFLLIGVSVLTTYQHHFIDIPTGVVVGMLCLWLWPDGQPSPLQGAQLARDPARRRLAVRYALGAGAMALVSGLLGGAFLWLCWVALALALVALIYAALGAHAFQKHGGRLSLGAASLLAPYTAGAWINSRAWTWRDRAPAEIADGVWIGRVPAPRDLLARDWAIVDLCAELPVDPPARGYAHVPVLDLCAATPADLRAAALAIEGLRAHGPVLVCCALGYSRSACAVAAWLLMTRRSHDVREAIARVRKARPAAVLAAHHERTLAQLVVAQ